ncbi:Hsp33 family molecular chaperone HslO [Oceanibacterium hippocampi]|uniref:33 kDa chaperonin n=1 Tax=Oceanibacterium hippocampi TaxID=745714 RepID=A0A1Y5RXZ8_9PROT|nr:Hsp33 family molecular chaperone HslO [Oceanibacterium hippocampi]SLN25505.1 33 kDa chaperonin [Oceanibacterium hippocampi]
MSDRIATDDMIRPFQLESGDVRGRLIRLGGDLDRMLTRHDYPAPVAALLGEAVMLAALLASVVKEGGIFSVQAQGEGPVRFLVADYRDGGALRGYASFDADAVAEALEAGGGSSKVPKLFGRGHLSFTVDRGEEAEPGEAPRYQGIVELAGDTLAECAQRYFLQSEQIETALKLAVAPVVDGDGNTRWRGGGLLLQRLPGEAHDEAERDEAWLEALVLAGTATAGELTDPTLDGDSLLYRLFHEPGIRVFPETPLRERCTCGAERVRMVLGSFPPAEIVEMEVNGQIEVKCEFCGRRYDFPLSEFEGNGDGDGGAA